VVRVIAFRKEAYKGPAIPGRVPKCSSSTGRNMDRKCRDLLASFPHSARDACTSSSAQKYLLAMKKVAETEL